MKDYLKHRLNEPSTLYGIASAAFGVAIAFGVPITPGQMSAVFVLLGAILGVTPDRPQ